MYDENAPTEKIPVITDEQIQVDKSSNETNYWLKVWLGFWLIPCLIMLPFNPGGALLIFILIPMFSVALLFLALIPGGVDAQVVLAEQDALRRQRAAYGEINPDPGSGYVSYGSPSSTKGR